MNQEYLAQLGVNASLLIASFVILSILAIFSIKMARVIGNAVWMVVKSAPLALKESVILFATIVWSAFYGFSLQMIEAMKQPTRIAQSFKVPVAVSKTAKA